MSKGRGICGLNHMKETKKTIAIIIIVALAAFIVGAIAYSAGLGEILPSEGILATFTGKSAASFGMKLCLISVLGVVFLVPSIRSQFSGSYTSGSNYKSAHKKGRGGGI